MGFIKLTKWMLLKNKVKIAFNLLHLWWNYLIPILPPVFLKMLEIKIKSYKFAKKLWHIYYTDVIYTDYEKVFDCLDHEILIWKLVIFWFHSAFLMLLNRSFYVAVHHEAKLISLVWSGFPLRAPAFLDLY